MEFEFLQELPTGLNGPRGKWNSIIADWLKSENKTLVFTCKNKQEFENCYSAVNQIRRRNKLDYTIFRDLSKMKIYLVRA